MSILGSLVFKFLFFSQLGYASTVLEVEMESFEKIDPVEANVVIENGQIISSNCDQLSQIEGMPAFNLRFMSASGQYLCVPENDKRVISSTTAVDIGFELNVQSVKDEIKNITDQINANEGYQASGINPQCSIGADGEIRLESCTCGSSHLHTFDPNLKSCKLLDSNIVSFLLADCSLQQSSTLNFLERVGLRLVSPNNTVTFAVCTKWRSADFYIPDHDLIYTIFYFSYFRPYIMTELKKTYDFENLKLRVSTSEIETLSNWVRPFLVRFNASDVPQQILRYSNSGGLGKLEYLPEVLKNFKNNEYLNSLISVY